MKQILKFTDCILLLGVIFFASCKKELTCEECIYNNQAPIANAGADQTITLPKDSTLLDGSGSGDPDGTIRVWKWTKVSGPASFAFVNADSSRTVVKNLLSGIYQFELKVTDDKNVSTKDTVQVIVNDPAQPNRPPVANAGQDQNMTLPANSASLNGSTSTDPDNNITAYLWTKIAGPSSFNILNATSIQTDVNRLVEGVYHFELKVTDAGGLFVRDTVQVTVQPDLSFTMEWQKTVGGTRVDIAQSIITTSDGGYIVAGNTNSEDGDITGYHPGANGCYQTCFNQTICGFFPLEDRVRIICSLFNLLQTAGILLLV